MSNSENESRREFLKCLGLALSCQYFGGEVFAAPPQKSTAKSSGKAPVKPAAPTAAKYKLGAWTGDDFTIGHKFRIGDSPKFPDKAEKKVDFIIVGGGVAGLTAAFNLKDHDFLLLEQYADLGGQSRGGSYHGIDFSYGAAYIGPVEGIYEELYHAIGIEPVALPPERNQYRMNNEWFVGVEGDKSKPLYKEFAKLIEESKPIWKGLPYDPDPMQLSTGDMQKLDAGPFAPCLKGYSKEFLAILDSFCRSSFGGGLEQLSALAGYSLLQDLVATTHVFKGGNPAIARALASKVNKAGSGRCINKAFVWKIEIKENGASVVYSTADGVAHRVDCKHVIVATPPMIAARQLVHIPDMEKANLLSFKFCSYLVANMLMKEKLFNGKYDCFVSPPFSFADITVAETPYMMTNSYKPEMGSVLTVYQPYANGPEGRAQLLMGDRQAFAESITKQMEKLVPGFFKGIDEVILTRWGHALAVVGPGYFSRLAKIQGKQASSYSLAHSSIWGWPAAESAIRGGKTAAERAMKIAATPGFIVQ